MNSDKANAAEQDWSTILIGESILFGLLGKILYSYPEEEVLQPIVDENIFTEAPFGAEQPDVILGLELLNDWVNACQGALEDEILIELRVDYTRLFTGTANIPVVPWESAYFDEAHLLFQAQTIDVRSWYRRFGLESVDIHQEPDDHIGLELAFVSHLAQLSLSAFETQETSAFHEALQHQRDFLSQHLLSWGPLWCGLVIEHAKTEFYRGIALILRGALKELAMILELDFPEVQTT